MSERVTALNAHAKFKLLRTESEDNKQCLVFAAPDGTKVKEVKYFPASGDFEMDPANLLPGSNKKTTYKVEGEMPIRKVEINVDEQRFDFVLANQSQIPKPGIGKSLIFGKQENDGFRFGARIKINADRTQLEANDVTGVQGTLLGIAVEITSFVMKKREKGSTPYKLIPKTGLTEQAEENVSESEFVELVTNATLYLEKLRGIRKYIEDEQLLATLAAR